MLLSSVLACVAGANTLISEHVEYFNDFAMGFYDFGRRTSTAMVMGMGMGTVVDLGMGVHGYGHARTHAHTTCVPSQVTSLTATPFLRSTTRASTRRHTGARPALAHCV